MPGCRGLVLQKGAQHMLFESTDLYFRHGYLRHSYLRHRHTHAFECMPSHLVWMLLECKCHS